MMPEYQTVSSENKQFLPEEELAAFDLELFRENQNRVLKQRERYFTAQAHISELAEIARSLATIDISNR